MSDRRFRMSMTILPATKNNIAAYFFIPMCVSQLHLVFDCLCLNLSMYACSHRPTQTQLLGATEQSAFQAKDCKPLHKLNNTITINPCGLIANTLFNDIITLTSATDHNTGTTTNHTMIEDGIAWQSDIDYKFQQPHGFIYQLCATCENCTCDAPGWCGTNGTPYYDKTTKQCFKYFYPNDDTTQYLYETYPMVISPIEGVMNEHFIVWMRTAALPKFRKLYGYFDQPVHKGTRMEFQINANWEVSRSHGSKSLILTTTSIFGGKNPKLGRIFFGVGYMCMGVGILIAIKHYFKPRRIGDVKYLKYKEM